MELTWVLGGRPGPNTGAEMGAADVVRPLAGGPGGPNRVLALAEAEDELTRPGANTEEGF